MYRFLQLVHLILFLLMTILTKKFVMKINILKIIKCTYSQCLISQNLNNRCVHSKYNIPHSSYTDQNHMYLIFYNTEKR